MQHSDLFFQLHKNDKPFVLGNCWNVSSAKALAAGGCRAIGTSSMAVAQSLGYEDGEQIPFSTLLSLAKKLVQSVSIPVSIDMEGGYSRSVQQVIQHIEQLCDAGVAGINIEDSMTEHGRHLQPVADFQKTLSTIADHISGNNRKFFINVRTDTFLLQLPDAKNETIIRAKAYEQAGANGLFVPCITKPDDIKAVVAATDLPVNVMCMPGLPDFSALQQLGVKRISMGGFFFQKVNQHISSMTEQVLHEGNFSSII